MTFRAKFLIPYLLFLIGVYVVSKWVWLPAYTNFEYKVQMKMETLYLEILGTALIPDLLAGDYAKIHETLNDVLEKRNHYRAVVLINPQRDVLFPLNTPRFQSKWGHIEYSIRHGGKPVGTLRAGVDFEGIMAPKIRFIRALQFGLLGILVLIGLFIVLFQGIWIRKPLKKLALAAERFALGDESVELPPPTQDEIGRFAVAFDRMRRLLRLRQAALRESENRLSAIIDNSVEGILAVDEMGLIERFNKAAEGIFGYRPAEVIGKPIFELMAEPHRGRYRKSMERFLQAGETDILGRGREVTGIRKDGTAFPMWTAVAAVRLERQTVFVVTVLDISEQKAAAEELRQYREELELRVAEQTRDLRKAKESAEAANRAKSAFLAAMSHEIRTPLNTVIGLTDLTLESGLTPEQKDNLLNVRDSANHLLGIINDILDLSKIEAGHLELKSAPFDLSETLNAVLRSMETAANKKGIPLTLHISPAVPPQLIGDLTRFRQILINLLGNAVKFTESGGVHVSVVPASAGGTGVGGKVHLKFSITDTGIGVPEEMQTLIFEAFRQAEGSVTRKYGGTGLGLAVCKRLVESMGGGIEMESRPGEGSEFTFTLPFQIMPPAEEPPARQAITPVESVFAFHRRLRILLAEDNPVNARMTEKYMEKMGHQTKTVETGNAVLDTLARGTFDVILMDVEMPEMDGFETARRIRNAEAGQAHRSIPIIAMTAHALTEFKEHARAAGMDDFITKPVDFTRLQAVMETLITKTGSGS